MAIVPYRSRQSSLPAFSSGFEEFDWLFDNFFNNALTNLSARGPSVTDMALRLDISEAGNAYLIKADLPGVEEEDVDITLEEGVLTISGEKRQEREEEGKTFHRIERSYGSFRRSLALPANADENRIEARMRNGTLEIEIGKTAEAPKKTKRIEVRATNGKKGLFGGKEKA